MNGRRDVSAWVCDPDIPIGKVLVRFLLVCAGLLLFGIGITALLTYGGPLGVSIVGLLTCLLIVWGVTD